MDGGTGCGGILKKSLGMGLNQNLGIRVNLSRKPRLEARPSQASVVGVMVGESTERFKWINGSKKIERINSSR